MALQSDKKASRNWNEVYTWKNGTVVNNFPFLFETITTPFHQLFQVMEYMTNQ